MAEMIQSLVASSEAADGVALIDEDLSKRITDVLIVIDYQYRLHDCTITPQFNPRTSCAASTPIGDFSPDFGPIRSSKG